MGKAKEEIKVFDKSSLPRLKREIAEIESNLKAHGSDFDERAVKLLNSRLSFLKEELKGLAKSGTRI